MSKIVSFLRDESGASAAEYALILAVVCAALLTAIGVLNTAVQGAINAASAQI